ncbi:uncharacterized protein LOC143287964 [Babylonia areolata]|uniref:uncharacterized protein LOC143287964 n=1 Tax=Babylonia areolata TaxID=304850 RepID=UPI003FD55028
MKLTLLLLLALTPAVTAFPPWFGSWRWPFSWGRLWGSSTQCTCKSTSLPIEDKLALLARDNDFNDDGLVTYDDLYHDLSTHYDTNRDEQLSEGECIETMRCRVGYTEKVAQYVCARIMQGEQSVPFTALNVPPFIEGMPLSQFLQINRQRLDTFYNSRCVNRDLTLEEKLELNAKNNDFNGDGLVTSQDLDYDLFTFYDADQNGEVTKAEFVARWMCNYGDSADYARYTWSQILQGAPTITRGAFNNPPFDTGVPIEDFRARNRQRYENYRTKDASAYIQG